MQLETITANIRSRSPWEAIDLGFAMVRAWWISIYTPLAILLLSIITVLLLLVPYEFYWVSLVILWWLKPLYHRLILYVISHQMFGESPPWSASLKALPDLVLHSGLFSELTWRRFSMSRGFRLPIWQLERLRGKDRRDRQQLLLANVHSPAIWLNIAIFSFQLILTVSFFMLIWLFIPEYYAEDLFYKLISNQLTGIGYSVEVIAVMGFVMVMVFLEPFYIAASFAMYLNRRTQLEAWDIELSFRKIANRLSKLKQALSVAITGALMVLFVTGISAETSYANDDYNEDTSVESSYTEHLSETRLDVSESRAVIDAVMQNEHLKQEEIVKRWRLKNNDLSEDESTPPWAGTFSAIFAMIIEYALWIAIAVGIIALYIYRKRWMPLLVRVPEEAEILKPDILFGMDLRKENLPGDVVAAASALWSEGKVRDALSLLYRCALAQLVNQESLPLEHSHTEGDILKLSQSALSETRHTYLQRLTQSWVQVAYAHEYPSNERMSYLLGNWSSEFASTRSSSGEQQ